MKPTDPMKAFNDRAMTIATELHDTSGHYLLSQEQFTQLSRAAARLVVDAGEQIVGSDEPVKALGERRGSQVESDIHAKIRNRLRFKQRQRLEFYRALLDGEVGK